MILSAIAAMARNRVIGVRGQLPWHLPEDLKYFKETTRKKTVIMGRKTFESIGRPLPDRQNIVLTRQQGWQAEGVLVFSTLDQALNFLHQESAKDQEIFIIGGGEIYAQALPKIQRLYLTIIDEDFEGDAYFPDVDLKNDFKVTSEVKRLGPPPFRFIVAERISQ